MIYFLMPTIGFLIIYALWVFFLAVMSLKRAKQAGALSRPVLILGTPTLFIGYLLDFLANTFVMTVLLMELPQETTVTDRLKRHIQDGSGWRYRFSSSFRPLLDPFDPSGPHLG